MNCPTCEFELSRVSYARANVHECTKRQGALLSTSRASSIERRVDKDTVQLVKEVSVTEACDTLESIRCPRCKAKMHKRLVKELDFSVDDCKQCGMSWFDGGELAAMQLQFEQGAQTVELNGMRNRLRSMTDEERLEYEASVDRLTDLGSSFGQAVRGATFELVYRYHR